MGPGERDLRGPARLDTTTDCFNDEDLATFEPFTDELKFVDTFGRCLSQLDVHGLVHPYRGPRPPREPMRNPHSREVFTEEEQDLLHELYDQIIAADITKRHTLLGFNDMRVFLQNFGTHGAPGDKLHIKTAREASTGILVGIKMVIRNRNDPARAWTLTGDISSIERPDGDIRQPIVTSQKSPTGGYTYSFNTNTIADKMYSVGYIVHPVIFPDPIGRTALHNMLHDALYHHNLEVNSMAFRNMLKDVF